MNQPKLDPETNPRPRPSSRGRGWTPAILGLAAILGIVLWMTSRDGGDDRPDTAGPGAGGSVPGTSAQGAPDVETVLRRERVAVFFAKEKYGEAAEELLPLIEEETPAPEDLVRSAQIALRVGDWDAAATHLDQALAIAPDDPGALYARARLAYLDYDLEAAQKGFERVLELAPEDPAAKIGLASILRDPEEGEPDLDRARELLEDVAGLGRENGLQWFVTAVYQRMGIAKDFDEGEEVYRSWRTLYDALVEQGFKPSREPTLDQGVLAVVAPPKPVGTFPEEGPKAMEMTAPRKVATLPEGTTEFWIHDLNGDRTPDIVSLAGGTLSVHLRSPKGDELISTTFPDAVITGPVRVIDLNQRRSGDTLDIIAAASDRLLIFEQADTIEEGAAAEAWSLSPVPLPALGGQISDLETVDFDHDGELDLLVTGEFGAKVLRNDGVGARVNSEGELQPRGAWVDASETATLPTTPMAWCIVEDFDGDNDVDFLVGGAEGAHLLDSQRRGLFVDRAVSAFGDVKFPRKPVAADLDGNGLPDLFVPGEDSSTLLAQGPPWTFRAENVDLGVPVGQRPVANDLDFDGTVDIFFGSDDRVGSGLQAAGLASRRAQDLGSLARARGQLAIDEIDTPNAYGTLALDVLRLQGRDLVAISPTPDSVGFAVYLKFIGQKDNRQGVGAVLEVRAKNVYRRIYLRGRAEVVGLGNQKWADVIRITWPNGVIQQELDVEEGVAIMLDNPGFGEQPEGLIGSCPFLYTWNGENFEFISDVIGITPLGLPIVPGMLVPPDHDEYVLVRGDQLKPDSNGELVLQFTEELREVTYLDRARLEVVDHPKGTSVYPNERFCFPPFPEPHTHVVERVAKVQSALGSDGTDWTAELQENDMRHPVPFERLGGQFLGLAEPHWLELEFNPDDFEGAELIRLVATGWFYWSDASVNVAAAGTPGVEFVPPTIQVLDDEGQWVDAGPPLGFPAGKTKTMVVDITSMVDPKAPRFRIGSTLELYWDCIELAVCNDDAELWTKSLEPVATELWSRGFSDPIEPPRQDLPLFFDWTRVTEEPRWNQHPGMYTRYGQVDELLENIDDQYVIMGSGDALAIRFDAKELPELPKGYERDYLVFLDGWAKDRDPNTYEALEVEPLPFHAMSGYPYGPDEAFPSTDEMQAWRAKWNTRPAHRWIIPLNAEQEREWVREVIAKSRSRAALER